MPKAKAKLILEVEYEGRDAHPKVIRALLNDIIWHATANALFTGEYDLEVDSCEHTVDIVAVPVAFASTEES